MAGTLQAGRAFFDLVPRLKPGTERDIERELGNVDGHRAGAAVGGKFSSGLKSAAVGLGAFFAAKVGADLFTGAVNSASNLNETLSKSRTIFGEGADEIERWGSGAASAIGQSKQQAIDAAATFGNLFVQLGVGDKTAAGMSKRMVELASDFASFHNADISEVISAQSAAFRGEYDAVQRFVPTINAAAVEQKALEMTLKGSTDELTAQDKALATQALLLEGAGDATGDFARTSDGLANKQRILAAKFEDVKAKIGQALIPVVTKLVTLVADNLEPALDAVGKVLKPITDGVSAFLYTLRTGFTEDEGTPIEGFALFIRNDLLPVLKDVADFVERNLKPILIGLGATLALLISPVGAVVAALIYAYTQSETFRNIVDAVIQFLANVVIPAVVEFASAVAEQFGHLVEWVQTHWDAISEAIGHAVTVIRTIIEVAVAAIELIWRYFGDTILAVMQAAWDQIRAVVEFAIDFVRGIIELGLALINGDWGAAWDAIKGILSSAWDTIKTIVGGALDVVKTLIGDGLAAARDIAFALFGEIIDFVTGLPGKLVEAAGDLWGWVTGGLRGILRGIVDLFEAAINAVIDVVNIAIRAYNKLPLAPNVGEIGDVNFDTPSGLKEPPRTSWSGWGHSVGKAAKGGTVAEAGLTLVGEVAPELLELPRGSRITPLEDLSEALAGAGKDGPLISIGEATFADEVDIDLLFAKAAFASQAGRFDG